jgi:hypothetical protein
MVNIAQDVWDKIEAAFEGLVSGLKSKVGTEVHQDIDNLAAEAKSQVGSVVNEVAADVESDAKQATTEAAQVATDAQNAPTAGHVVQGGGAPLTSAPSAPVNPNTGA